MWGGGGLVEDSFLPPGVLRSEAFFQGVVRTNRAVAVCLLQVGGGGV